jgi:RNA polymerase sigma-70 factor, ECF subfamily
MQRTNSQIPRPLSTRRRQHQGFEPELDMNTVYRQYHRRVRAWCSRIARNTEDAEDLTQDVFVQVIRKIRTFRGEAAFSTWLYRVVMNTVFMQLRRKRLPLTSLDEVFETPEGRVWRGPAMFVAAPSWRDSDARIDLNRAIGQLPNGFKVALLLHDVEAYHHSEIAKLQGWTVGTSKSQLHKARERVRKLLERQRADENAS